MDKNKQKRIKKGMRHSRVRAKVFGTSDCPRLSVFRSGKHIYAQVIDDSEGKTLAAESSLEVKAKGKKTDVSKEVGKTIAVKVLAKKISEVVFDRGGYKYHGRVKALAEGAREAGLKF